MKSANLYDSATIIITGDHSSPYNDYTDINEPRQTALFYKPANSSNENLKISNAQVCQKDIWPTIFEDQGITSEIVLGTSILNVAENENRNRKFVWHTYEGTKTKEYTYNIFGAGNNLENYNLIESKTYNRFIMD